MDTPDNGYKLHKPLPGKGDYGGSKHTRPLTNGRYASTTKISFDDRVAARRKKTKQAKVNRRKNR